MRRKFFKFVFLISFTVLIAFIVYSYYLPKTYFYSNVDKSANGLRRFVYEGDEWMGKCQNTGIDNKIVFNNKNNFDFKKDYFSIRWISALYVPKNEMHKFKISSDDGSYLYVDNKLIIDNGGIHCDDISKQKTIFLMKGFHMLVLDYSQAWGEASMSFSFERTGEEEKISSLAKNIYPVKRDFDYQIYQQKVSQSIRFRKQAIGLWFILVLFIYPMIFFFRFCCKLVKYIRDILEKTFAIISEFFVYIIFCIKKLCINVKIISKEFLVYPSSIEEKLFLILVLFFAFFLRFYSLKDRGLIWGDEYEYFNYIQVLFNDFAKLITSGAGVIDWILFLLCKSAYYFFAKPGHELLMAFGSILLGVKISTALYVSAFLSFLTVYLIFLLAKRLFGIITASVCVVILSVSAYNIMYARSTFGQSNATFFLSLGMCFYVFSRYAKNLANMRLFISGLCVGYAFTCHYCVGIFPILLGLYEVENFIDSRPKNIKNILKRIIILFSAMAVPLLFFELLSRLGHRILPMWLGGPRYLERLFSQSHADSGGYGDLNFYGYVLFRQEGPIVITFLALGIILSIINFIKNKRFEIFVILLWFLAPLLFWSFNNQRFGTVARSLAPAIPAVALISGWAITQLTKALRLNPKMSKIFITVTAIGILVYGAWNSKSVINMKSIFTRLVMYLNEKNIDKVIIIADPGLMGAGKIADNTTGYPPASRIKFYIGYTEEKILSIAKQENVKFMTCGYSQKGDYPKVLSGCEPDVIFKESYLICPSALFEGSTIEQIKEFMKRTQEQKTKEAKHGGLGLFNITKQKDK